MRAAGYRSEHPGLFTTISDGIAFVDQVVQAIHASDYAPDTLVLLTWDEGGGFFDHVAPPPPGSDDAYLVFASSSILGGTAGTVRE